MKYVFIINPAAGDGRGVNTVKETVESLPEKKDCTIYETKGIGDATVFVKKWITEHPGEEVRFIACGGDGTLNEVFNGALGVDNASVTCYPCGSGNDFVKVFGGAETFADIHKLLYAPVQPQDKQKLGDRYSDKEDKYGFDTTVDITVNVDRDRTGHGNKNSYTKGIIKALFTSMNNKAKVYADGKLLNPNGRFLLCTVANGQYVGGSFKCAPRARVDDGLMEVCLIKPISRLRFVKVLKPYTNGQHLDDPAMQDIVTYCQAKKVEVEAPDGFAYSLDGEIIYENHFTVEIVPYAIRLAVPKR